MTITDYDKTSAFTTARDLLDRYDNLSSKLHIVYLDPDKKPQVAKVAGIRAYGQIIVDSGTKKEEAKSLSEEEITGALIRSLKSGERNACFVSGSGEHGLDDTGRTGYANVKEALEKSNYKTRTISLLGGAAPAAGAAVTPAKIEPLGSATPGAGPKPEVPADCTVLVVAGPKYEYMQPAVDAIQKYVTNGGRLLVMLDPALKLGRDETQENTGLDKMLDAWGVTMEKDLAIDASGVGQIFGLSEVVPLVTSYESHPIVRELKETATAFPLARTLEVKTGGREAVFDFREQLRHHQPELGRDSRRSQEGQEGPARSRRGRLGEVRRQGRPFRGGGELQFPRQQYPEIQRQPRPVSQHDELAQLR